MYQLRRSKQNKVCFIKEQKGMVLPIILVSIFLLQISFYGAFRIYENKMNTYGVLMNHYQVQTILLDAEKMVTEEYIKTDKEAPSSINYNIGTITIIKKSANTYELTSKLSNGYNEIKEINIPKSSQKIDILNEEIDSADDKHRLF